VSADKGHVANIGTMIEAMESDMRSSMDALYISKTREICGAMRSTGPNPTLSRSFVADLTTSVREHGGR
jgi:capping protein beta